MQNLDKPAARSACTMLHWYGAGYMFNIGMLKTVFSPTFQMHDIRQTREYEITTRWTMTMRPTLNRISPFRRWWDPTLIFTGVSIMAVNPENGDPFVLTSMHYMHSLSKTLSTRVLQYIPGRTGRG